MIWDPTWNAVEENLDAAYLFPNPIERGQTMHLVGNAQRFDAVLLYDLCGRTVLKVTSDAVGDIKVTIPADFSQGCYIVKMMRNNSVVKYQKLLVK